MAIELAEESQPARRLIHGDDAYEVAAGERVQIRHGPTEDPVTDLYEQCPAGKKWTVYVSIQMTETDA